MLIDKNKIAEAKEKFAEKTIEIIREDLKIDKWDEKNLRGSCPLHEGDDTPSFIWNSKDNCFHCFSCNHNYGIIDHYMDFYKMTFLEAAEKLFGEAKVDFKFSEKGLKQKDYRYPKHEEFNDREEAEQYLANRKISVETMDAFDVQADEHGNIVFHFYDQNDVLKLVKYRPSHKIEKGENKTWCQKNADTSPLLFNMNRVDPSKPLVITEGEIDSMSVFEAGYHNVVSIPLGAGNTQWIQENYDWLEQFEKIIIWADNDEPGLKMRKEACSRLGVWRTLFVEIPEEITKGNKHIKDANAVLIMNGKETVLDLITKAQEMPIVGVDDLSTVDDFDLEKSPGLYTHIKPIDDLVYKFLLGSVAILTGTRGSGKSTLLNQAFICEALNQGLDTFIFSGELSAPVLKTWFEMSLVGPEHITMKDNVIHIIDPESKKQMREWYKNRVWVYNQLDNSSDAVLDRAVAVTRRYGVKLWVIDNLMTLAIGENENNELQKQKEFIVKLVGLAKLYGVLIILVSHPRKLMSGAKLTSDDIAGSGNLGNMVQYIISVRRVTEKEKEGELDRNGNYKKGKEPAEHDVEVEVLKNRYTGRIGTAKLNFHYETYRFWSSAKELNKRYGWDRNTSPISNKVPESKYDNPFETHEND